MRDVLIAELVSPDDAVETARRVRQLGYSKVEAYSPFPIPELDEALDFRRTRAPWLILLSGLTGATAALFIEWWTNAFDYPLNVGARPRFSIPSDVPIIFETTVLLASFAAFGAALLGARLPRLHDPVFDLPGFERTNVDRFWIVVNDAFFMEHEIREAEEAEPRDEAHCARLRALQDEALAKLTSALESAGAVVKRSQLATGGR